jgi:hypothetical protein
MAPTTHEIDPDADTVITLKNASAVFAPWDAKGDSLPNNILDQLSPDHRADSTFAAASGTQEPSSSTPETVTPVKEDVYFRVSSRHLILASPWFKRALTNEAWSESYRSEDDGLFHITVTDWDAEAFLILLNVLHLRTNVERVPRTLPLEMLSKIAVLVDYYECGEAIEFVTTTWIDHVRTKSVFPTTYCRDLILWIWVAYVFNLREEFRRATKVTIAQSDGPIRTLGLPIPSQISSEFTVTAKNHFN